MFFQDQALSHNVLYQVTGGMREPASIPIEFNGKSPINLKDVGRTGN